MCVCVSVYVFVRDYVLFACLCEEAVGLNLCWTRVWVVFSVPANRCSLIRYSMSCAAGRYITMQLDLAFLCPCKG